jgi:DNA polymerase-3 subunit gamma/tau
MAYQVIARKYRPQRFADVVGQEHVTQTLANAIQQNRIAHAYLFCGPRGTGKTTVARIFAKCLNCTDGPKVDFDDADPRCVEITEGRAIDVLEIDGASNNGVEQVRELRETVKYAPASSRFKIYIIDEVHMLTTQAFNALLKTLEEPPAHVKFMFATTDPEKVLPTILSRCQRFDLRRIPVSLITRHLASISKLEKVSIDEEALHAIARGADGGMRDAESALDQLISFCGNRVTENDVLSMFGLTARSQVVALAQAVLEGEAEKAFRELNSLAQHGKDLGRLLSDLLGHFRNLLLFQVSKGDVSLLEVTESEVKSLQEQSAMADIEALTRVLEALTEAEGRLRDAASKKIFVEVSLLKAIQARKAVSIDFVIQRLQQWKGDSGAGLPQSAPATPSVAPMPKPGASSPGSNPSPATVLPAAVKQPEAMQKPEVAPPATPAAAGVPPPVRDVAVATIPANQPGVALDIDLVSVWGELMDAVGRASPFTRGHLVEAYPLSLTNTLLTIGYDPEFADEMALADNAKTHSILQTKLGEAGHRGVQVRFIQAERPPGWVAPRPASSEPKEPERPLEDARTPIPGAASVPSKKEKAVSPVAVSLEDFKNDPLIRKALEIFKGQIVEVRA